MTTPLQTNRNDEAIPDPYIAARKEILGPKADGEEFRKELKDSAAHIARKREAEQRRVQAHEHNRGGAHGDDY